jgi:ABC-type anion transport system duplicated permease subunit
MAEGAKGQRSTYARGARGPTRTAEKFKYVCFVVHVFSQRMNLFLVEQNRLRLEQTKMEREKVLAQIEVAQRAEELERSRKEVIAQQYRDALVAQMESVEEKKREEKHRKELEVIAEKVHLLFRIHEILYKSCIYLGFVPKVYGLA